MQLERLFESTVGGISVSVIYFLLSVYMCLNLSESSDFLPAPELVKEVKEPTKTVNFMILMVLVYDHIIPIFLISGNKVSGLSK